MCWTSTLGFVGDTLGYIGGTMGYVMQVPRVILVVLWGPLWDMLRVVCGYFWVCWGTLGNVRGTLGVL